LRVLAFSCCLSDRRFVIEFAIEQRVLKNILPTVESKYAKYCHSVPTKWCEVLWLCGFTSPLLRDTLRRAYVHRIATYYMC